MNITVEHVTLERVGDMDDLVELVTRGRGTAEALGVPFEDRTQGQGSEPVFVFLVTGYSSSDDTVRDALSTTNMFRGLEPALAWVESLREEDRAQSEGDGELKPLEWVTGRGFNDQPDWVAHDDQSPTDSWVISQTLLS